MKNREINDLIGVEAARLAQSAAGNLSDKNLIRLFYSLRCEPVAT